MSGEYETRPCRGRQSAPPETGLSLSFAMSNISGIDEPVPTEASTLPGSKAHFPIRYSPEVFCAQEVLHVLFAQNDAAIGEHGYIRGFASTVAQDVRAVGVLLRTSHC